MWNRQFVWTFSLETTSRQILIVHVRKSEREFNDYAADNYPSSLSPPPLTYTLQKTKEIWIIFPLPVIFLPQYAWREKLVSLVLNRRDFKIVNNDGWSDFF